MDSKLRGASLIVLGVIVGTVATIGENTFADSAPGAADVQSLQKPDDSSDGNQKLPLAELRKFVAIMHQVKQGYVEKVSDKTLLDNALHGMIEGLDRTRPISTRTNTSSCRCRPRASSAASA